MRTRTIAAACALALLGTAGCAAGPLTTREKGGLFGGVLGAGAGALIGRASGNTAAGAAIGGPLGLLAGGVIGDQLQAREQSEAALQYRQNAQEQQIRRQNQRIRQLEGAQTNLAPKRSKSASPSRARPPSQQPRFNPASIGADAI